MPLVPSLHLSLPPSFSLLTFVCFELADTWFGRNAYAGQGVSGAIPESEVLVQQALQSAGYVTGMYGKNHLGCRGARRRGSGELPSFVFVTRALVGKGGLSLSVCLSLCDCVRKVYKYTPGVRVCVRERGKVCLCL